MMRRVGCILLLAGSAAAKTAGEFTVGSIEAGPSELVKVQTLGELPTDMPMAPKTYDQRPKILGVDVLDAPGSGGRSVVKSLAAAAEAVANGNINANINLNGNVNRNVNLNRNINLNGNVNANSNANGNANGGKLTKLQAVLEKLDVRQSELEARIATQGSVPNVETSERMTRIEETNERILAAVSQVAERISGLVVGRANGNANAAAVAAANANAAAAVNGNANAGQNALDKLEAVLSKLQAKGAVLDALTAGKRGGVTLTNANFNVNRNGNGNANVNRNGNGNANVNRNGNGNANANAAAETGGYDETAVEAQAVAEAEAAAGINTAATPSPAEQAAEYGEAQ